MKTTSSSAPAMVALAACCLLVAVQLPGALGRGPKTLELEENNKIRPPLDSDTTLVEGASRFHSQKRSIGAPVEGHNRSPHLVNYGHMNGRIKSAARSLASSRKSKFQSGARSIAGSARRSRARSAAARAQKLSKARSLVAAAKSRARSATGFDRPPTAVLRKRRDSQAAEADDNSSAEEFFSDEKPEPVGPSRARSGIFGATGGGCTCPLAGGAADEQQQQQQQQQGSLSLGNLGTLAGQQQQQQGQQDNLGLGNLGGLAGSLGGLSGQAQASSVGGAVNGANLLESLGGLFAGAQQSASTHKSGESKKVKHDNLSPATVLRAPESLAAAVGEEARETPAAAAKIGASLVGGDTHRRESTPVDALVGALKTSLSLNPKKSVLRSSEEEAKALENTPSLFSAITTGSSQVTPVDVPQVSVAVSRGATPADGLTTSSSQQQRQQESSLQQVAAPVEGLNVAGSKPESNGLVVGQRQQSQQSQSSSTQTSTSSTSDTLGGELGPNSIQADDLKATGQQLVDELLLQTSSKEGGEPTNGEGEVRASGEQQQQQQEQQQEQSRAGEEQPKQQQQQQQEQQQEQQGQLGQQAQQQQQQQVVAFPPILSRVPHQQHHLKLSHKPHKFPLYESPRVEGLAPKCRAKLRELIKGTNELISVVEQIGQKTLADNEIDFAKRDLLSRKLAKIRKAAEESLVAANLAKLQLLNDTAKLAGIELIRLSNLKVALKYEPNLKKLSAKLRKIYGAYRKSCKGVGKAELAL